MIAVLYMLYLLPHYAVVVKVSRSAFLHQNDVGISDAMLGKGEQMGNVSVLSTLTCFLQLHPHYAA
jgi:hypothetical protein